MFANNKSKIEAEEISTSSNIIGKGTLIEGNFESSANIRIEGKVIGNIKTRAKIALGESAVIEGNIIAQNAEIAGQLIGNIEIADTLVLRPTAIIRGEILTNKMAVEVGANFNGTCKMGAIVKDINLSDHALAGKQKTA